MFAKSKKITNDNVLFDYVKGVLVAAIISLGLIVLFAFCIKWFSLSDSVIAPVTLAIKGVSVLIGTIVAVKGDKKGLLKGFSFGEVYMLVAFVVFSILSGDFTFSLNTILDFAFAGLLGGVVGIVKVNKK